MSLVVLGWVLILGGLLGLIVAVLALADALSDMSALAVSKKNGPRRIVVWGSIRAEAVRLAAQILMAVVGLTLLLPDQGVFTEFVQRGSAVIIVLLLVLNSALDRYDSHRLYKAIKE